MSTFPILHAALLADSLCLGPHWIYDAEQLKAWYPDGVLDLEGPRSQYHPQKQAGDNTHYGDQTLALWKSLRQRDGYDEMSWREDWSRMWSVQTHVYRDGATRTTLENLAHGRFVPSPSHDLAGAVRSVALFAYAPNDAVESWVAMARSQTAVTHGDTAVLAMAEWLARAVHALRAGVPREEALQAAMEKADESALLQQVLRPDIVAEYLANKVPVDQVAAQTGLSCDVFKAATLTLFLMRTYGDQPEQTLMVNAGLGGDSAGRGMMLGALLAAEHGDAWLPERWIQSYRHAAEITGSLL